jgi:hypothetical protein
MVKIPLDDETIELSAELVRISAVDIEVERYNKMFIATDNSLGHHEVRIDLSQNDLYDIIMFFGASEMSKIVGAVSYKLVEDGKIVGFMDPWLSNVPEIDRIDYIIFDFKAKKPTHENLFGATVKIQEELKLAKNLPCKGTHVYRQFRDGKPPHCVCGKFEET